MRKIDDERKYRKRRSPSYEKVVVGERKEKRFHCAHCEYVSRAQYITARHVARIHQLSIKPLKCDLSEIKTIYKSNLKRHHERMHNKLKSDSSESESKIKSEFKSEFKLEFKSEFKSEFKLKLESSDSSILPLN